MLSGASISKEELSIMDKNIDFKFHEMKITPHMTVPKLGELTTCIVLKEELI